MLESGYLKLIKTYPNTNRPKIARGFKLYADYQPHLLALRLRASLREDLDLFCSFPQETYNTTPILPIEIGTQPGFIYEITDSNIMRYQVPHKEDYKTTILTKFIRRYSGFSE